MACAAATVLGPLTFPEPEAVRMPFGFTPWEDSRVGCIFCEKQFVVPAELESFTSHLCAVHRILVADFRNIASVKGYIDYWRVRFTQVPIQEMCPQFSQEGQSFYLLSPETNHEDVSLRRGLASKRLEWVLESQRVEREEGHYGRGCLFCRHVEDGTRADYLSHLAYQHNLQLGRPDNIVFVDKLIDKIEGKLKELKCIYCELIFRDRDTLKEHMRKKFHKRVNPKNVEYDRFYVNSYIEGGGKDEREEEDVDEKAGWGRGGAGGADSWSQWREEGSDWSDWKEDPLPIVCLFCPLSCPEWDKILTHMNDAHKFSYRFIMGSYNYYEQVKIVNFIRRETHLGRCYECKNKFPDEEDLVKHINGESHCTIPDRSDWDHPEFFFPTYENDTFLYYIEDKEEDPVERLATQLATDCGVATPGTSK